MLRLEGLAVESHLAVFCRLSSQLTALGQATQFLWASVSRLQFSGLLGRQDELVHFKCLER